MADEPATDDVPDQDGSTTDVEIERQSFLDRLGKESQKRKAAEQQAKDTAARLAELEKAMEDRESAGLPELELVKKDLERAQKRAEEAEQRATEQDRRIERSRRERMVSSAASEAKVKYPDLLVKDVDLDSIESEADATRAVKGAVKKYPDLVQSERPDLPGRVLENGRTTSTVPGTAKDPGLDEAEIVASELQKFLASRGR